MVRFAAIILLASSLTACQTGTTVVIEQPTEQVAKTVTDHYMLPAPGIFGRETKVETSGPVTRVTFYEEAEKTWAITTLITVAPSGKAGTRITIHTDDIQGGLVMTTHVRREEIEGHRMGEILRLLNIEPLPRSHWQGRGH